MKGLLLRISKEIISSKRFHVILLIFWCSFIIFRLGTEGIINMGDTYFELDMKDAFFRQVYSWEPKINGGYDFALAGSTRIVTNSFLLLLSGGMDMELVNRIWFILALSLQALGAYYLVLVLLKEERNKNIYALLAAIFFLSNPQSYNHILGTPIISISRGMMNFAFAFYLNGVREKNVSLKYASLTAIAASISFIDLRFVAFIAILLLTFFFFNIIIEVKNKNIKAISKLVKFSGLVVLLLALLNFYWYIDAAKGLLDQSSFVGRFYTAADAYRVLEYISGLGKLHHTLRLGRGISANDTSGLLLYNTNVFLISSSVILMFITYSSILLATIKKRTHENRLLIYLMLLLVVSIGFTGGSKGPFRALYMFLWFNVPIFQTFRVPLYYMHFSVLAATCLFAISIAKIFERFRFKRVFVVLGGIFLLILMIINGFPFYSSQFLDVMAPSVIPKYYHDTVDWLKEDNYKDNRLFIMPPIKSNVTYDWSKTDMADILLTLSPLPLITTTNIGRHNEATLFNKNVYELFESGKVEEATKLLSLKNVGYVMLRHDLSESILAEHNISTRPGEVKGIIEHDSSKSFLKLMRSFDKLDIYKVSYDSFLPHIYPASAFTVASNNTTSLVPLTHISYLDAHPTLALTEQWNQDSLQLMLSNEQKSINGQQANFVSQ